MKPESPRVYQRNEIKAPKDVGCRKVATIHIQGARYGDIEIYDVGSAYRSDIFWVDDPAVPVIVCTNTIRQAINHALKGAGWG